MRSIKLTAIACALVLSSLVTGLAGPDVYFGNLHSHTSYSDGSGTPAEAYKYARDTSDLDFLAITEHNHLAAEGSEGKNPTPKKPKKPKKKDPRKDGILIAKDHSLYNGTQPSSLISAAKKFNEDGRFVAIYGQEFSTISAGNHVNVFEIGEVIDETAVPKGEFRHLLDWLETRPDSQQLPAIIQFNHPEKQYRDRGIEYGADDFGSGSASTWHERMSKHVRLIEVLNGPGTINKVGLRPHAAQSHYLYYLNAGFKIAPTGDQDNHWKNWGESTETRTGVIADSLTKPQILEALRNRHVYASEDRNLKVMFLVNGRLCGDVIPPPATNQQLDIKFSIVDEDEPEADYEIEVFSDNKPGEEESKVIETVTTKGNNSTDNWISIEDVPFTGEHQYLFFKITQSNEDEEKDHVWTAPVWFETSAPAPPPAVAPAVSGEFVASKNSKLYHAVSCSVVPSIKEANKVSGAEAKKGRTQHEGCQPR
jgi:hypothetical protein